MKDVSELTVGERQVLTRLQVNEGANPFDRYYLTFDKGTAAWRKKVGPQGVFSSKRDPMSEEDQRILGRMAISLEGKGLVQFAPDGLTLQTVRLTEELGRSVSLSLGNTIPTEIRRELA